MTTLNPSHNPFRKPEGRHAQAIHDPSSTAQTDSLSDASSTSDLGDDEKHITVKKAKKEGRKRVRAVMPPMPDMRFEQVRKPKSSFPPLSPGGV